MVIWEMVDIVVSTTFTISTLLPRQKEIQDVAHKLKESNKRLRWVSMLPGPGRRTEVSMFPWGYPKLAGWMVFCWGKFEQFDDLGVAL